MLKDPAQGPVAMDGRSMGAVLEQVSAQLLGLHAIVQTTEGAVDLRIGRITSSWGNPFVFSGHATVTVRGDENNIDFTIDEGGKARINASLPLDEPVERADVYRQTLLLTGTSGTKAFGHDARGRLVLVGSYPRRHWSLGFVSGPPGHLLRLVDRRTVQRWKVTRLGLDRRRFAESLELRYRPLEPTGQERGC